MLSKLFRTLFQLGWLRRLFHKLEVRVLMLGLDAAGKTTMLYSLKLGEVVSTIPTIGINFESIETKNISLRMWDIGGRGQSRALARYYYPSTDAVIFVVDSNDRDRIDEARVELEYIANEPTLAGLPVLVLANKQDLPAAMAVSEISERLDLPKTCQGHPFMAVGTTAARANDQGIHEGFEWLRNQLENRLLGSSDS